MSVFDFPLLSFDAVDKWEEYLSKNHEKIPGVWLKFFKKKSGVTSINYAQALEVVLCYGWIDSKSKSLDEKSYMQKFTPRRSKSIWSKVNTANIDRLIKEKRMKPAGLKVVEEAKKDGRWSDAYDSPSTMEIPLDFMKELKKDKKALEFFQTLNKTNVYAITWRLQTAKKPETRARRMAKLLEMLSQGEKLY